MQDSKSKAYPYRSRLIPFTEIWCILGQREKIYAFFIQVIHGHEAELAAAASQPLPDDDDDAFD
ncbi:unnamed protein product [Camellia sinensis]